LIKRGDIYFDNFAAIDGTMFNYPEVYNRFFQTLRDGDQFLEVGSFEGKSICYLATLVKQSGKEVKLWTVEIDPILGSKVKENIKVYDGIVSSLVGRSLFFAKYFEPRTLDIVFIDGDHEYEGVSNDIEAWLPKVKNGGIIAGHDYDTPFPGVMKAVDEAFGTKINRFYDVWIHNKDY